jgi:DNA-directed RNA polymerase alpha subunit
MLDPTRELTDETPISHLELTTRIRNALNAAGLKTVGEVRETSDKTLLSLPDFGQNSLSYLRERLSLLSTCR